MTPLTFMQWIFAAVIAAFGLALVSALILIVWDAVWGRVSRWKLYRGRK